MEHICLRQAAGFAVLVVGTLVYARGDQKEEEELKAKHSKHRPARTVFRFFNSMHTPMANTVHVHNWRAAVHRVASALHLEEGASHHH